MDLEKILPTNGPSINEVKKYIKKKTQIEKGQNFSVIIR